MSKIFEFFTFSQILPHFEVFESRQCGFESRQCGFESRHKAMPAFATAWLRLCFALSTLIEELNRNQKIVNDKIFCSNDKSCVSSCKRVI